MVTPPKPNRYMTYANAPFIKKFLYITKRKWEPNIQHHSKRMTSGLVLKYRNGERFVIRRGCETSRPARLKLVLSDKALCKHHSMSEVANLMLVVGGDAN